jgi:flagellar biosynthesis protein FlhB
MANRELATPSDLEDLRERGLVPYSPFATKCMGAAAFLLCVAILWRTWSDTPSLIRQFISYSGEVPSKDCGPCMALRNRALGILIVIPCLILLASLVIGLFQTRFLFYWGNLGFSLSRLNNAKMFSIEAIAGRIGKAFILGAILLVAWVTVLIQGIGVVAGLLNADRAHFLIWPQHAGRTTLPIAAFVLALLGFLCWISARVIFRYMHRGANAGASRDLYQDE